jgi:hypothetical protein
MLVDPSMSRAIRQWIGERHREERNAGQDEHQRDVTQQRERRAAHDRQHRRQGHLRPAAATQQPDHQQQDDDRQQHDEHEERVLRPLELQIAPAGSHPLVPRGTQRDRKIFDWGH